MSYNAYIAKIDKVESIEGANTIQKAWCLGSQIIVSKDTQEGDIGIFFPDEGRLSHDYLKNNNLYRHTELNLDPEKSGFFDDNRRVRTQTFLKQKSEGFFASLDSVGYTGHNFNKFKVGDSFNELNGQSICVKYVSQKTLDAARRNKNKKKKFKEIFTEMFPQHFDTEQFRFNKQFIKEGDLVTLTAKKHGTSGRYGYVKIKRNLPRWKQWVNKVVPAFTIEEWQYLAGTRRVDLFESDRSKQGYHGSEEYRFKILDELKPYLTKGMVVYGEICGWANGTPIMAKHDVTKLRDKEMVALYGKEMIYSYGNLEGECDFTIYRISMVQEDGSQIDFTWPQIKKWCEDRGLKCVTEVHQPFFFNGNVRDLEEVIEKLTEREEFNSADIEDPRHIYEGVVIRIDNGRQIPLLLKNKNFAFKVLEGIAKENNVDIEDEESEPEAVV